jgi:hypothetical protein
MGTITKRPCCRAGRRPRSIRATFGAVRLRPQSDVTSALLLLGGFSDGDTALASSPTSSELVTLKAYGGAWVTQRV